eukprot:2995341-Pyramimonas_sp.AAC.1
MELSCDMWICCATGLAEGAGTLVVRHSRRAFSHSGEAYNAGTHEEETLDGRAYRRILRAS